MGKKDLKHCTFKPKKSSLQIFALKNNKAIRSCEWSQKRKLIVVPSNYGDHTPLIPPDHCELEKNKKDETFLDYPSVKYLTNSTGYMYHHFTNLMS